MEGVERERAERDGAERADLDKFSNLASTVRRSIVFC